MIVLTEYLCTSVTYLGFCHGGYMILSSIPAFIARGLKLGLRTFLHILYSLWGSCINDPIDLSPSRKYATYLPIYI